MSRASSMLRYGCNLFNLVAARVPKIPIQNPAIVTVSRNFSSEKSISKKVENRLENVQRENSEFMTKEQLIEKVPEVIFAVKSNRALGNAIVSWHPEVPFPYEMSKPLPIDVRHSETNLKIQSLVPVREVFRKKYHKTVVRELMHLTYTTKHRWFGRFGMERRRYVKKYCNPLNQQRDREFL